MKVLVIHNNVPKSDSSGADTRLMEILFALRRLGHDVTFVALKPCSDLRRVDALVKHQITTYAGDADQLRFYGRYLDAKWSLDSLLKDQDFDLAILTLWFWSFLSIPEHYLAKLWSGSPRTIVGVLTDDRHGIRQEQAAKLKRSLIEGECAMDHAAREREIYRKSDLVLTIADAEKRVIAKVAPNIPCFVIPFSTTIRPPIAGYHERSGICLLANYANIAACDAGRWLLGEIFPLIERKIPDMDLVFAGPYSERYFTNRHPRVHALGQIDNIHEFFEAHRVFISPLRFGTGIATKNVVAMSHGIPVVTTSCGAQSLGVTNGINVLCADNAQDIAAAVVRAYTDEALWQELSRRSVDHATIKFSSSTSHYLQEVFDAIPLILRHERTSSPGWSACVIEAQSEESQEAKPTRWTSATLTDAYLSAGYALMREGRPDQAAAQFRHAITFMRSISAGSRKYYGVWLGLEQCYRSLGENELSERCRVERELHDPGLRDI